jgi:DNA-binding beta-propeller fold protein YncE
MPYNKPNLSREEVILLRDWINSGAPNRDGGIKFSGDRKKFYVTNQGCDVVTVFDQATGLPMRYVNVGASAAIESPHMVRVSPDGQYWYVVFTAGQYIEKYRTLDDSFSGRAFIGSGSWNSFTITNNSQTAYCIDFSPTAAQIATVNLTNMTAFTDSGLSYPHGCSLDNSNTNLYITQQEGNDMYKFPLSDFSLFTTPPLNPTVLPPATLKTHDVRFTPDGTKYFVTCQGTSEVRAIQTSNDSLLAIINVGAMPSELSFSTSTPYVFVTCMEDVTTFPGKRGSVAIINYNDYSVSRIYTGHQPHGIEVDENKKIVYVVNRNNSSDGPAPHHSSECAGKNGNISFIDLMTRTMVTTPNGGIKKIEIAVDPYSVSVKQ